MTDSNAREKGHLAAIETVRTGVHILSRQPSLALLESSEFFNAIDFGRAGVSAGKTVNYGQGVMRDIALQMIGIEAENRWTVNGQEGGWIVRGTPEYALYDGIFYIMNNPDQVKKGSRNRLLLGTQLVYDVWRVGEGELASVDVPTLGKVGRKIVSMLFVDETKE